MGRQCVEVYEREKGGIGRGCRKKREYEVE